MAELALEVLARELGTTDPLPPDDRATLNDCRGRLERIHAHLAEFGWDVELHEPAEADVDRLLGLLEREAVQ